MQIGLERRLGAPWIDHHEACAAPFGLLHVAPTVEVRDHRIAAPDDDQPGLDDGLGVHADPRADGGLPARRTGRGTDRAIQQRGAEPVEEAPIHARGLHQPHRAGVAVREDGARIIGGDGTESVGDRIERLVPADTLETTFALAADALHRVEQPLLRINPLEIVRDLGAQRAVGERQALCAADLYCTTLLDGHFHRAGVGAIVRTCGTDDTGGVVTHEAAPTGHSDAGQDRAIRMRRLAKTQRACAPRRSRISW